MKSKLHIPGWFVAGPTFIAWALLITKPGSLTIPMMCLDARKAPAVLPMLQTFFVERPPLALLAGALVMLLAMMALPLYGPLRYIYARSLARRRTRSMFVFAIAYFSQWLLAYFGLLVLSVTIQIMGAPSWVAAMIVLASVGLWQVCPWKQRCLNRCHGFPALRAFGSAADRDTATFGLSHAWACVGSCWALMLVSMLAPIHVLPSAIISLWIIAERLEPPRSPGWRFSGPRSIWYLLRTNVRGHTAKLKQTFASLWSERSTLSW